MPNSVGMENTRGSNANHGKTSRRAGEGQSKSLGAPFFAFAAGKVRKLTLPKQRFFLVAKNRQESPKTVRNVIPCGQPSRASRQEQLDRNN